MNLNIFKSYEKFHIKIHSPIVALRKLKERKITLINFTKVGEYEYEFLSHPKFHKEIIDAFEEAVVIKEYGFHSIIKNMIKKKTTIFSLIVAMGFFVFSSNIIIDIKIEGNEESLIVLVENKLEEYDFRVHKGKPSFAKIEEVENKISHDLSPFIERIEIRMVGLVLNVKYEKRRSPIILPPKQNNLYAKKDGMISYFEISQGERVILVNDFVRRGDLLVKGTVTTSAGEVVTLAEGKVFATTWSVVTGSKDIAGQEESELLNELLQEAKYSVGKNFSKEEEITAIQVLHSESINNKFTAKFHITALENIAIPTIN